MPKSIAFGSRVVLLTILAGCASSPAMINSRESGLTKAGFQARPASSPQQTAMLNDLTPYMVVAIPNGSASSYVYADPKICHCLYVGDEQAWAKYQQVRENDHIADRQVAALQMKKGTQWSWSSWQ